MQISHHQQLSGLWKSVLKVRILFQSLIKFNLGNGSHILFWHDTWLFPQPIEDRFPCLFSLASEENISIAEAYLHFRDSDLWPLLSAGPLEESVQSLRLAMSSMDLSTDQDTIHWKWFSQQQFSTKKYYNFIMDGGIRPAISQIPWKIKVPEKVKYFLCLSINDKILTKSNLIKRGWKGADRCSLCDSNRKMTNHLFLQCLKSS